MNRLADEVSPYLLQHRDNPVDWYPWGDEAFAVARLLDRPVFLSVGYSTCHWCHVMAHESFEDALVGRLMNETFVSVKVDREERPDVDHIYMSACQAARGRCGWPLTVLLTPRGEPFFVATYLPRESRHGVVGMIDLVPRVRELWASDRANIERSAAELTRAVDAVQRGPSTGQGKLPGDIGAAVEKVLLDGVDAEFGGFGTAPKFPASHNLLFLLERATRYSGNASDHLVDVVAHAVDAIRSSGTFDQVGGGIHRYATDRQWKLPHFEKMLYDQALFVMACSELSVQRGSRYTDIAIEVADYVLADLAAPEGAFYCAEDADSEGEEGKFYTWQRDELEAVLSAEEYAVVERYFGITSAGNYLDESTGGRNARNVLHPAVLIEVVAADLNIPVQTARTLLSDGLATLHVARQSRVRPGLDDKVLTDWNGLMIAALSRLGVVAGRARLVAQARRAATWILEEMRDKDGQLLHRYRVGIAGVPGMLSDYAFLLWGLLELFEAEQDPVWIEHAVVLADDLLDRFADSDGGAFFMSSDEASGESKTLVRPRELTDGAMPGGNTIAALALGRLFSLTGEYRYRDAAHAAINGAASGVDEYPGAFGGLALAAELMTGPKIEVVVFGGGDAEVASSMVTRARRAGTRRSVVTLICPETAHAIAGLAPFTASMTAIDERSTAYVCEGGVCDLPVADLDRFAEQLAVLLNHQT